MNDSELITAVRESVTGVHTATPVEQIITRGRAMRARRRIPPLAGAMTVVIAAVLAVTVLLPGHQSASHQSGIQLAAWTVVKRADGTVLVTIRELRDPAGLQRRLRADGVPASVTFSGQMPRSCRRYPVDAARINRVYTVRQEERFPVMVIHPSALPPGAGVQINPPAHQPIIRAAIGLVHASPQCTGS